MQKSRAEAKQKFILNFVLAASSWGAGSLQVVVASEARELDNMCFVHPFSVSSYDWAQGLLASWVSSPGGVPS